MLSRFVCSALEEMRASINNLNIFTLPIAKRHLASLVEEIQTNVNRMENALEARPVMERLEERHKELKTEIRDLKKQRNELKRDIGNTDEPLNKTKELSDILRDQLDD